MIALLEGGGSPIDWVVAGTVIVLSLFSLLAVGKALTASVAQKRAEEKVERLEDERDLGNTTADGLVDAAHADGVFSGDVSGELTGRRPAPGPGDPPKDPTSGT